MTDWNRLALGYLEIDLDACSARGKDMLHLGQWAVVPQEAIFFGNRQDVTYDLVHALCPESNAV